MLQPHDICSLKGKRKLTMLTAYDYPTAKILSKCGIDIILVGDSLGMVVLGYPDTKSVTLDDIIRHTAAVVRGNQGSFIVADMPFHTTHTSVLAFKNCRLVLESTGAHAVKIEGQPEIIQTLRDKGIPVMGHTGLKPQTAEKYRVFGRNSTEAESVYSEALALEKAGIFALVLECVPTVLASKITANLKIPVIGIGAGDVCDGQVLVSSDMIGLYNDFKPKFVRRYADTAALIEAAVLQFKKDVQSGEFPSIQESY